MIDRAKRHFVGHRLFPFLPSRYEESEKEHVYTSRLFDLTSAGSSACYPLSRRDCFEHAMSLLSLKATCGYSQWWALEDAEFFIVFRLIETLIRLEGEKMFNVYEARGINELAPVFR